MAVLRSLALSLGLTLVLELSGALALGMRRKEDLLLVGLVNVLTNPLVVLICNLVLLFSGAPAPWFLMAALEISAVVAEGWIYRRGLSFQRIRPFILSVILNGISYMGGLLLS